MPIHKKLGFFVVQIVSILLLTACGGGGGGGSAPATASVSGIAQKGAFIKEGTTVMAYQLDDVAQRPAGGNTATGTMNDNGQFSIPALAWTGWTEIVVTGKYADETKAGAPVSGQPITLTALINIDAPSSFTSNINILTHLQAVRTKAIIAGSSADPKPSVADAYSTALSEIKTRYGLSSNPDTLNTSASGDDNVKLLAVSGAFLASSDNDSAKNRAGDLGDLSTDFADGTLDGALAADIDTRIADTAFVAELQRNTGATSNQPPQLTSATTFSVSEAAANGSIVGTLTATDPESDPVTFSLVTDDSNGIFAVAGSGEITVKDNTQLDAETTTSYTLTVKVEDNQAPAGSDSQAITITVTDVADVPPVIAFSRPASVPKLFAASQADNETQVLSWAAPGTVVGKVTIISAGDSAAVDVRTVTDAAGGNVPFEINDRDEIVVAASGLGANAGPYSLQAVYTTASGDSNAADFTVTVHRDFSLLEPRVMPLGDSITYAGGADSYRKTLKSLSQTEIKMNIDFIGTSYGAGNPFSDTENEGWNGFSARDLLNEIGANPHYCDIAENERGDFPFVNFSHVASCPQITDLKRSVLEYSLAQQVPDLVLIHIGTNDFFGKDPAKVDTDGAAVVDYAIASLGRVVQKLRDVAPNVVISIAKIIPLSDDPALGYGYNYIPLYNTALETFVSDLNTAGNSGNPVTLVDQYTDFDPAVDLGPDGVHPNDTSGNPKIGTKWFNALKPIFGIGLTPPPAP